MKLLELDLDVLHQECYFYTKYDMGNSGNKIVINLPEKELFLDEFAREWRARAECLLEDYQN